ncbi:Meckel syndrome type 1 protein-like [Penaeus chinensis]|uniref:Meckel syndrome type 1 protein-like n=1 Tax=Penaeus chinensis TaxID=139456 RepID=UPI001FB79655|nr:Meckel syndrome type 1 protein-like [Penaeus chinensis]XP_047500020.1 Meckel syndrome type 1 protein-like [Penaeus chinensis]XP_047500021.1 Meckel syndrome type 1 protein-like [Penaeus chinensis]
MNMEPARDHCAYYYTKEQIENLRIRTVLQQLTGSQLVDASPRAVENPPAVGEVDLNLTTLSVPTASTSDASASHTQQQVIKWQQKLLSPFEIVEYGRPIYAEDSQHKSYHEQAVKLKKRKQWKRRIFTYTHQDNYQSQIHIRASTTKQMEPETCVRQRKRTEGERNANQSAALVDGRKGGEKNDPEATKSQQQHFYIMADLAPPEFLGETRAHEVILCTLRYNPHGQLTVSPDFTKLNTKPFRLESFGSDNALYEYTVENVSLPQPLEEKQKENELLQQISRQRMEEMQQIVGLDWNTQQLGEGEIRLVVTGEICRAQHFSDVSSLYLHYVLHLPPGWRHNSGTDCEGFTPTCVVGHLEDIPTVHYSTPFTVDVTRTKGGKGWPQMLLAVFSVDWWGRERDEGYASFVLPTPGYDSCNNSDKMEGGLHQVGTWRPAQSSPIATMRRFFLGGCQLMADSSYLAVEYCSENSRKSRLGFRTVTSGTVELRTNTLIESNSKITESWNSTVPWNAPIWQLSTRAVLDAFNKSRQKLRAAKQGV